MTDDPARDEMFALTGAQLEDRVLRDLRKLSRAVDIHSRKLVVTHQLTGPQLVCLRELAAGPKSPSHLAREVSLSHATVTGILRRLSARELVVSAPSPHDGRSKIVSLTDAGHALVEAAPSPLQEHFVRRLHALPKANQAMIHIALRQLVEMMGAEDIDAAPVLATGPINASPQAVEDLLDPEG